MAILYLMESDGQSLGFLGFQTDVVPRLNDETIANDYRQR